MKINFHKYSFLLFNATGLLYGAALGDAIGIATDNMTPDECRFHYNPQELTYNNIVRDEHRTHWRQGDWTDQFDQVVNKLFITSLHCII